MVKKTESRKTRLGKKLKRNRRMPLVAILKTHRRLQSNKFARDWKHRKLRLKG